MNQSDQLSHRSSDTQKLTYRVVFKGLRPDIPVPTAKSSLAQLFNIDLDKVDRLLAVSSHVIKKSLSHDIALKYQAAINNAGGMSEVHQEGEPVTVLDIDPLPVAAVKNATGHGDAAPILFQGDASLVKSAFNVVNGDAVGTAEKFTFVGDKNGPITLLRGDVSSAIEAKHGVGLVTKWVVTTKTGDTYQFHAANGKALRHVMLALSGDATADDVHVEPDISSVKNKTAWLAAVGPSLAGLILILLGLILGWNLENPSGFSLLKIWIWKLAIIYLLLRIDHLNLQQQGFNTARLGLAPPEQGPVYLFSRAKAFGHSKAYAITWCVLFTIEVLGLLI